MAPSRPLQGHRHRARGDARPDRASGGKACDAGQALRSGPAGPALRRRHLRRGRTAGERASDRPAGRRRRDRARLGRRPPRAGGRERPDREGRIVGCANGREDRANHRGRASGRAAGVLVHRQRRRADHRPGRPLPGPAGCRADLQQPGRPVRQGSADLLPVRSERRRRRLHPVVLRRGVHGRGQRVDVPRLPTDGRDGGRREGHAGGDGRRPDARLHIRLR